MRMNTIARWIAALALVALAAPAYADGELNVVCSAPIPWCEAVAAAFFKETGIRTNLALKEAADALAQLAGEKSEPRHDVWFAGSGERHLQAGAAELSDAYASPLLPQLRDWAVRIAEQSKGRSVGLYATALGLGFNTRTLARKQLPEPRCWADLARPEYHDELQIANPVAAGGGYVAVATLVQIFGEDKAFELLGGMHRNVKTYPRTAAGAIRAAARGETSIAVAFLHDGVSEIANGVPIRLAVPCEGTGYDVGAMSLVKGAPHPTEARRFYDWALTPDAQRIAGEAKQFHVPSNKATPMPAASDWGEVRLIPYDFARYGNPAERQRLLDKWEREVHALPR
jgi:iron(III) transport system substrate-binding protein